MVVRRFICEADVAVTTNSSRLPISRAFAETYVRRRAPRPWRRAEALVALLQTQGCNLTAPSSVRLISPFGARAYGRKSFTRYLAVPDRKTGDYLLLDNWRYLVLVLFWTLLIVSIFFANRNWREDRTQRTGRHLGVWLMRVLIGCMWFQDMLWKLPLLVSDGLQYWTEQESTNAAFEFRRTFLKDTVLPHMTVFGPIVFLAELVFAGSMILGLAVRFVGALAVVYTLQLWLGLYDNSSEWPWTYMFLSLLMFLFAVEGAGRSLGFDSWLRREVPAVRDNNGFVGWFFMAGQLVGSRGRALTARGRSKLFSAGLLLSQLQCKPDKRRGDGSSRGAASDEIAGDLRHSPDAPALSNADLFCRQTSGGDARQHLQIPTVSPFLHTEPCQLAASNRVKRREIRETRITDKARQHPADIGGDDLLRRQAAVLTRSTNARAEDEDGSSSGDRDAKTEMNSATSLPSPSRKTSTSASPRTVAMAALISRP
jgi:uncharacterized membrane protein YphA (DoxX/SURF4 family)